MKRVSIKQVAEKAGVSTALVSYILNNRHMDRISKETAEKVKIIAKELNYQPSRIAQSLKSNKTNIFALLVADINNFTTSRFINLVEEEARKKGHVLIIGSAEESLDKLEQQINFFKEYQVDGFIIEPVQGSEKIIQDLLSRQIPVVLINRFFKEINIPVMAVNNYGVSYQATTYSVQQGKKNIGFLIDKTELESQQEKLEGYKKALEENGISLSSQNLKFCSNDQEVDKAIEELFFNDTIPDALFFSTSKLAVFGLRKLSKINTRVLSEINILVFDESEIFDLFKVSVVQVRQPLQEIAEGAVETLLKINEDKNFTSRHRIYNAKIVLKKSH